MPVIKTRLNTEFLTLNPDLRVANELNTSFGSLSCLLMSKLSHLTGTWWGKEEMTVPETGVTQLTTKSLSPLCLEWKDPIINWKKVMHLWYVWFIQVVLWQEVEMYPTPPHLLLNETKIYMTQLIYIIQLDVIIMQSSITRYSIQYYSDWVRT